MEQENLEANVEDQLTTLLQIPLIFDIFVENLQLPDLVRCSGVNKFWCVFFREYIHKNRKCNIRLDWLDSPCLQLKEFNDLITSSTFLLPFNGISTSDWGIRRFVNNTSWRRKKTHICSTESHANLNSCASKKTQIYSMVLRNVGFKYLPMYESTNSYPECPMNGFLREALVTHADQLETISCHAEDDTERESSKNALEYFNVNPMLKLCWLPKVTTINLGSTSIDNSDTFAFCLYQLIKFCPNLNSIDGHIPPKFLKERPLKAWPNWTIPKESLKCITQVFNSKEEKFWRLAREKPQLKSVNLYDFYLLRNLSKYNYVNVPLMSYLLRENCLHSLRILTCSMGQLVTISQEIADWSVRSLSTLAIYGIRCLEELEYLKFINLNRMFPQVTDLHLWLPFPANENDGHWNLIPNLPTINYELFQYSDSTVRNLHIFRDSLPFEKFQILAHALPNISNFTYHSHDEVETMLNSLWILNWPKMETIKFCYVQFCVDIDHVIFGLNPEEREYIENRPDFRSDLPFQGSCSNYSAFNLKGLRKIQLEMDCCIFDPPPPGLRLQGQFLRTPVISPITAQRISKQFPSGFTLEMIIEPIHLRPDEQPLSETPGVVIENQGLRFHPNMQGSCSEKKSKYLFIFNE